VETKGGWNQHDWNKPQDGQGEFDSNEVECIAEKSQPNTISGDQFLHGSPGFVLDKSNPSIPWQENKKDKEKNHTGRVQYFNLEENLRHYPNACKGRYYRP
jgi:hypothetical protein